MDFTLARKLNTYRLHFHNCLRSHKVWKHLQQEINQVTLFAKFKIDMHTTTAEQVHLVHQQSLRITNQGKKTECN